MTAEAVLGARPELAIELIERPNEKPRGTGEPSAAMVPSATERGV